MKAKISLPRRNHVRLREVLLCLLFYNVQGVQQISWLATLSDVLRTVVAFAIVIAYVYRNRRFRVNKIIIYTAIIAAITFLSTLTNSDNVLNVLIRYAPILSIFMYMTFCKERLTAFLFSAFIASEILVYINLFAMILVPGGITIGENMAPYWIIGQKQDFAAVFVFSTIVAILFYKNGIWKKRSIALLLAMFVSIALAISIGLVVFWCGLFILLLLPSRTRRIFRPSVCLCIYLALSIVMIWLALNYSRLLYLQTILRGLSTTGMTKDETFGSRTLIWLDALSLFLKHPIIGNGLISEVRWESMSGMLTRYHPHFHNMAFDLLATGGACSLLAYIGIQITLVKKLNTGIGRQTAYYLTACIFAMNIHLLIECYYTPLYWAIYMCAYYWDEIEREMEAYRSKRLLAKAKGNL